MKKREKHRDKWWENERLREGGRCGTERESWGLFAANLRPCHNLYVKKNLPRGKYNTMSSQVAPQTGTDVSSQHSVIVFMCDVFFTCLSKTISQSHAQMTDRYGTMTAKNILAAPLHQKDYFPQKPKLSSVLNAAWSTSVWNRAGKSNGFYGPKGMVWPREGG